MSCYHNYHVMCRVKLVCEKYLNDPNENVQDLIRICGPVIVEFEQQSTKDHLMTCKLRHPCIYTASIKMCDSYERQIPILEIENDLGFLFSFVKQRGIQCSYGSCEKQCMFVHINRLHLAMLAKNEKHVNVIERPHHVYI